MTITPKRNLAIKEQEVKKVVVRIKPSEYFTQGLEHLANLSHDESVKLETMANFFPGNPALSNGPKNLKSPYTPDTKSDANEWRFSKDQRRLQSDSDLRGAEDDKHSKVQGIIKSPKTIQAIAHENKTDSNIGAAN